MLYQQEVREFCCAFKVSRLVSCVFMCMRQVEHCNNSGLLAPPTALLTEQHTSTHDVLMWEDPYTLNLTAVDPDITGYTITIAMSDPPPHYPYDLPLTLDQLTDTRNQTFTITSAEGQQFPFPRYAFPVWLSVRAENPAGLGDPSQHFRYITQLLDDCMRINGE